MVEGLKRVVGGLCGGAAGITRPTLPPPKKSWQDYVKGWCNTHDNIASTFSCSLQFSFFFFNSFPENVVG